jgi:hypothetical protein
VAWTPNPPPPTLEQAGIHPGSGLLATPEEVAQQEKEEAERLAVQNAHVDAVLASIWQCHCCGVGTAVSRGLCTNCLLVIDQQVAARAASEQVNGRSRRDLALEYLARQES